jgi:hypothetical protein
MDDRGPGGGEWRAAGRCRLPVRGGGVVGEEGALGRYGVGATAARGFMKQLSDTRVEQCGGGFSAVGGVDEEARVASGEDGAGAAARVQRVTPVIPRSQSRACAGRQIPAGANHPLAEAD